MQKVIIILADGVEETEFIAVADVLRRMDLEVTVAGLTGTEVTGAHGFRFLADKLFAKCAKESYDAVFLPGGQQGALAMKNSEPLLDFLRRQAEADTVMAAICAAPMVLAQAGLLLGKRFTMYPGLEEHLPAGCVPENGAALRDGAVVTGKGAGSVFVFARLLAEALSLDARPVLDRMFAAY